MPQSSSKTSDAPLQVNTSDHTMLGVHPKSLAHMNAIDTMTAKMPSANTWFTLPFDIRDEIYNILLMEGNLGILRASKDIHEEARHNVFKVRRLRLNLNASCANSISLTQMVPEIAEKIRKVELHINVGSEVSQEALRTFATTLNLLTRSGGSTKTCDVILEIASRSCNFLHWLHLEEMLCQCFPAGPNEGETHQDCQVITGLKSFKSVTVKVVHMLEAGISNDIMKKRRYLGVKCARGILGSHLGDSDISGICEVPWLKFCPLERTGSSGIAHAIGLTLAQTEFWAAILMW